MKMARFRISDRADKDIGDIARYTIERHGIEQARHYRAFIIACFEFLSENPEAGRAIDDVRIGYRCFNHQSHVIFYKADGRDVLIVRVLHNRMDVAQQL
jgi:toxin ParE1/3/4